MKTFLIEKPEAFSFGETKMPEVKAGEVLLKIERVGLCGGDLTMFRGLNPMVTYPRIPGHEIAATIAEVSAGVPAHLQPDLLVTVVPYRLAQMSVVPREASERVPVQSNPRHSARRRADGVCRRAVAKNSLFVETHRDRLRAGRAVVRGVSRGRTRRVTAADTVAVFGAGMIGLGAIAGAALRKKARVIAIDLDDQKLALAKKAGAAEVINSKTENLHERLQQLTNGEGPAVVIEAVGAAETFVAAVNEVCFTGRVVYIGYAKKPVAYETKFFVMKELDILGSRNALPEDFENVIRVLESGLYPVAETVTRVVPFAQAGEALKDWSANPATTTKIHVQLSCAETDVTCRFYARIFRRSTMKTPLLFFAALLLGTALLAAEPLRQRLNFNREWKFQLGDVRGAEAVAYDDSKWNTVGLPHSFSTPYFQGKDLYTGYGWYRKSFDVPAAWLQQRVFVEFDGAFQDAEVFVNGRSAGRHRGGYTGFSCVLPGAARGQNFPRGPFEQQLESHARAARGRSYFSRRDLSRCLAGGDRAAARHLVWHLRHDAGSVA